IPARVPVGWPTGGTTVAILALYATPYGTGGALKLACYLDQSRAAMSRRSRFETRTSRRSTSSPMFRLVVPSCTRPAVPVCADLPFRPADLERPRFLMVAWLGSEADRNVRARSEVFRIRSDA